MPSVRWIDDPNQFQSLASAWNSLAPRSPCLRHEWLTAWWEAYGSNDELRVAWVTDDDGLPIGALPAFRQKTVSHGRLMRLIGSGEVCSDFMGVLAAEGWEKATVAALVESLTSNPPTNINLKWDEWDWEGVAENDLATAELIEQLSGSVVAPRECGSMSTWRVEFPAAPYLPYELLSKKMKQKLRRLEKQFDSGVVSFHSTHNETSFARGQQIIIDLHQKRRQMLGEPGCFSDSRFEKFYRSVSEKMFHRGLWKVFWVELDGQPIGVQTGPFLNNIFFSFQTGCEPAAIKEEPGWLVQIGLLRSAAQQGWHAIDFMRGDEEYKSKLGCVPTASRRLRMCYPRISARSRFALYHLARDAKRWWDSVPNTLPSIPAVSHTQD